LPPRNFESELQENSVMVFLRARTNRARRKRMHSDELDTLLEKDGKGGFVILPAAEVLERQRNELSLVAACCVRFELTRSEARALVRLLKYDHATKQDLHSAIYCDSPPPTKIKVLDPIICRLRKKIAPYKIANIHGVGFCIEKNARDKILGAIAPLEDG
jgi:DNA-binding response OmpR family regulator